MLGKKEPTVFSVYCEYLRSPEGINKDKMLKSILVRYITPGLGGSAPKGQRSTDIEIKNAEDFLQKLPSFKLIEAPDVLEKICEEKGVNKNNRKAFRSILKDFIDWAVSHGYCQQQQKESTRSKKYREVRFRSPIGEAKFKPASFHKQFQKESYALMAKHSRGQLRGQPIYPDDYINERLNQELKNFETYRLQHDSCAYKTVVDELEKIYQFFGWLHRYKNIPLSDLSFQLIIPYRKLNISLSECIKNGKPNLSSFNFKKIEVLQFAISEANDAIKLISEYVEFYASHPNSKMKVITTSVALAKFIFSKEIGTDDFPTKNDIPIIRRLYQLNNQLKEQKQKHPPAVSHHQKSVSWEIALEVLEKLRKKAITYVSSSKKKKYLYERPRSMRAVFNDLQKFLSLAFMVLMPPSRSRTYYDLEVDTTFVEGIYKNGLFTPKSKMKEPRQAEFYIHLYPADYKTGASYGEWWGKVPNIQFSDSSFFYEYINLWLTQGRDYYKKCEHKFFFKGIYNNKKLNEVDWGVRISNIFFGETNIPVTPKEIRKMYVTYLYSNGATDNEKESAAYAMQHSREMQSNIYNEQDKIDKLTAIYKFNERLLQNFFKKG